MASRIPRIACPDPRATQEPEGGGWEPSARIRAFRSQLRARTRSTESPLDFPARRGPEPSGWSEMDQLGPKTGRVQPRRPPFVEFRDSLYVMDNTDQPGDKPLRGGFARRPGGADRLVRAVATQPARPGPPVAAGLGPQDGDAEG